MGLFRRRWSADQDVEQDFARDYSEKRGDLPTTWAAVRNPELSASNETLKFRLIVAGMLAALPVSLIALLVVFLWRPSAATDDEATAPVFSEWQPLNEARANQAAAKFACWREPELCSNIQIYGGRLLAPVIGGEPTDETSRTALAQIGRVANQEPLSGAERYVFLLRYEGRYEQVSFLVSEQGQVSLPFFAYSPTDLDGGLITPDGAQAVSEPPTRADIIEGLGFDADPFHPTCPEDIAQEEPPRERFVEFIEAFVEGDQERLQQLAAIGGLWNSYIRSGFEYVPETFRFHCVYADGEELAVAEVSFVVFNSTTQETFLEMRDVVFENREGLLNVRGADRWLSGGQREPEPINEEDS